MVCLSEIHVHMVSIAIQRRSYTYYDGIIPLMCTVGLVCTIGPVCIIIDTISVPLLQHTRMVLRRTGGLDVV